MVVCWPIWPPTLLVNLASQDIEDLVSPDPDLDALLTDLANSESLPELDVDLDGLLADLNRAG